jgi:hypothetical protein
LDDRAAKPILYAAKVSRAREHFIQKCLQYNNKSVRDYSIWQLLQLICCSSFDAKQPPYRILFQREPNATCLQIAVSDSEEAIEAAWDWIRINMILELEEISSPFAKEEWVVKQMNKIVSATITGNETRVKLRHHLLILQYNR